MQYAGVPLTEDFAWTCRDVGRHAAPSAALVFLAYPNNPSGNLFDADAIVQIIEAAPGLV